jgi:CubicO group peptidase (beta-lactamase class C family)
MRHPWLLSLSILACMSARVFGDAVDDFIQSEISAQRIPGISVAVVKGGKLIRAGGYGLSNIELDTPARADTVYQMASMTKQFTAAGVMVLLEDGKLALDDPVSKYLDAAPAGWSSITIRHMLTMTSGIEDYNQRLGDSKDDFTSEKIFRVVAGHPLDFKPAAKWSYSNSNYILLGLVIQKVSGKSWNEFLADRIFGPLGMKDTRRDEPSEIVKGRAALYEERDNRLVNCRSVNPSLFNNGDGGLLTTVLDVAKWDAALAPGKLLKKSSLEQMFSPVQFNGRTIYHYGFGWFLNEYPGHRIVLHGGGRPGSATQISRFIDDQLTVVVLANRSGINAERLAHEIAKIFVPALPAYGPHPIEHPIKWTEAGELIPLP